MKRRGKFDRRGLLAMKPESFGLDFLFFNPEREPFELVGQTALVRVQGPLTHHDDWFCYSYDQLRSDVAAALASEASEVLLVIDSPGGEAAGCFGVSREIRTMAASAGKPLNSYIEGVGASGGYAIACAGQRIYASDTAIVGSIGVICPIVDVTKQDAMFGERWTLVTSGSRKADGNPHKATDADAVSAVQGNVDSIADVFFRWVAEGRAAAGLSPDLARSLEAGVFVGEEARKRRLVDQVVSSLVEAIATARVDVMTKGASSKASANMKSSNGRPTTAKTEKRNMGFRIGWKEDMKKAADEGDEDAKRCLEALDGDEDKPKKKPNDGGLTGEEKAAMDSAFGISNPFAGLVVRNGCLYDKVTGKFTMPPAGVSKKQVDDFIRSRGR